MNIFSRIALQSMKKSRSRTIVTVIGVILSAAMITAVAAFGTSLLNFLLNNSIAKYGDWHIEFPDVPSSFVRERAGDKELSGSASFENIGYAVLDGAKSPEKPYLFIAGFSEDTFNTLPVRLISGRMPENSKEVLVPAHIAIKGGVRFKVGDTLSLAVGTRTDGDRNLSQHDPYRPGDGTKDGGESLLPDAVKTYTVTGICERPGFEEHSAPGYTLITKADASAQTGSLSFFATLKKPRKVSAYAGRAAGGYPFLLNDSVLRFMGISENRLFNTLLYTVGLILAAIIMTGSVFLIYNSFNISLNERIRQFGILSSVGATSKQLLNSVLFEGLCIGAAGIPAGILAGIGSVRLLLPVVAGKFRNIIHSTVPLTLSVSVPAIAAAAALSLVTILISAYIPARKASNTPVMECIRQTNEVKTRPNEVKTSGLALRLYGLEGTLALKNFKRNKKRYRTIVMSLVLSVVLFVSGSAFSTTLKRISQRYIVDIGYDIFFDVRDMEDSELLPLYDRLKSADGVYKSMYQTVLSYVAAVDSGSLSSRCQEYRDGAQPDGTIYLPMDIQFIPDREYLRFISELGLPEENCTGPDADLIAVAKQRTGTEKGSGEIFDLFKEPSMTLSAAPERNGSPIAAREQKLNITFADTYPVDPPPKQASGPEQPDRVFMVIAPDSVRKRFETPDTHKVTGLGFWSENPSESVREMELIIQDAGITSKYTLYNLSEILDQFYSAAFVIDVFTYVFVIMISLIAVANVFNTISTNIRLRRRELAMLRSVGMSGRDFNKMMTYECVFYGMWTLFTGLPLSAAASWLIYRGLASVEKMENFHFVFPWRSMAASVFSVLLIVFITMMYAVSRLKRENIIDALRDDMT